MTISTCESADLTTPCLRPVEVQRVTYEGSGYFLLNDSLAVASQPLLVPQYFGGVLALADGRHTLPELLAQAQQRYHAPVAQAEVEEMFALLEEAGYLEGERFRSLYGQEVAAWRAQSHRPPALAGAGYPAQPQQLHHHLQQLLDASDAEELPAEALDWSRGVALLSPHIDYPRGGSVYASAWKRMGAAVRAAEVAVILATDHKGDDPFTFTTLDYATPYGVLPTDARLRDALTQEVGEEAAFAGELRHRNEHSIELVVNWLHHLRGAALPIVPVLVGSLHRFVRNGGDPSGDTLLNRVIETIRAEMQVRKVLVVASGDLAHVGPAFGGASLDASGKDALRAQDFRLLQAMAQGDAEAFFSEIRSVRDRNNVCGVAPIYLTMRCAEGVSGVLTGYNVTPADEAFTSVVSIAGVAFA